jgi:hypothetical protein
MTREGTEVRPSQTSLITKIGAGLAFFAVASSFIPFLAGKIGELRSLSPSNPSNEHATVIYSALSSPPVTLDADDIKRIESMSVFENNFSLPFAQLESLDSLLLISVGAFLVALSFLSAFLNQLFLNRSSSIVFLSLASIFSSGVSLAILGFIVRSGRADWDEVYLFASAAENFAKHGIPGVSVSGNNPFAESSVDFLVNIS